MSINFFEKKAEEIESLLVKYYESMVGECREGSPQRGFIKVIVYLLFSFGKYFDAKQKMNLLNYSKGEYLDAMGEFRGGERGTRLKEVKAFTTFEVEIIESVNNQTLEKGYRVSANDGTIFETTEPLLFTSGETIKTVPGQCTTFGTVGNGYLPDQINKEVDIVAFVLKVRNISTSQGGAEVESDSAYRERLKKIPESYSVAGPVGAYESMVLGVSPEIIDVQITSPSPGEVLLQPLLKNGELPDQGILDKIIEACNDNALRPLTDKVIAGSPIVKRYNLNLTYYVSSIYQTNVDQVKIDIENKIEEWILLTKSKLGKDINPDLLIDMVRGVGCKRLVIESPVFTKIEDGEVANVNVDTKVINYGGIENEKN